jgi:hypothetical protein
VQTERGISAKVRSQIRFRGQTADSKMEETPLDTIIKRLQERDIPADRGEFQKAIAGENRASVEEWIAEYMGSDTLLTKDELSL